MRRRGFLAGGGATVAGVAGCLGIGGGGTDGSGDKAGTNGDGDDGDWCTATFTDVRSGEEFSVDSLASERPVLLETFAVWCSTCLR